MRTVTTQILILTLAFAAAGTVAAEEGSLLARLETECQALAARADAATVEIRPIGDSVWEYPFEYRKAAVLALGGFVESKDVRQFLYSKPAYTAAAVLVGSPPVLVTSSAAVGKANAVAFRLADGTTGEARLWACDSELGVAVFRLPEEVAKGREGLSIDASPAVARGRLAIVPGTEPSAAGRPLSLVMVRGGSPLSDWFAIGELPGGARAGQPALGVDGRLLGIAIAGRGEARPGGGNAYPQLLSLARSLREHNGPRGSDPVPGTTVEVPALRGRAGHAAGKLGTDALVLSLLNARAGAGDSLPEGAFLSGALIARVLHDLEEHGRVRHGYLGVMLGTMRGEGESRGVEIRAVLEGSPAAAAGLTAGTVIRAANGRTIDRPALLDRVLGLLQPGDSLRLGIAGSPDEIPVVLGDRTEEVRELVTPESLGLTCVELGPDLAGFLGLPAATRGVVVRDVSAESRAAQAGFARGDVIRAAGGEAVVDLEELRAAFAVAEGQLVLEISRGEGTGILTVRFPTTGGPQRAK